jgi:hypothetical protein
MVPRGEVALIIAGIGLSGGLISEDLFQFSDNDDSCNYDFHSPASSRRYFLSLNAVQKLIFCHGKQSQPFLISRAWSSMIFLPQNLFRRSGMKVSLVHSMPFNSQTIISLKETISYITMTSSDTVLDFRTDKQDVFFVKTIVTKH